MYCRQIMASKRIRVVFTTCTIRGLIRLSCSEPRSSTLASSVGVKDPRHDGPSATGVLQRCFAWTSPSQLALPKSESTRRTLILKRAKPDSQDSHVLAVKRAKTGRRAFPHPRIFEKSILKAGCHVDVVDDFAMHEDNPDL